MSVTTVLALALSSASPISGATSPIAEPVSRIPASLPTITLPALPPTTDAAPPPSTQSAPDAITIILPPPPSVSGEVDAATSPSADTPPQAGGNEIVVTAREESPADPLSKLNAASFNTIQAVDGAVIGPVAKGYEKGVPKPVRSGLRNFLRNLEEPVIALNYLLQLKPGRAAKSVARFAVNSTFGVAGLIDVAKDKPFNLPYTPNGFANTFACYGIGPGPYFFLPLVGPTTLRDVIGVGMDRATIPLAVGKPFNRPYYAIPANVIDSLNDRVEIDGQLDRIRNETADPYVATRELYLKQRKAEIAAICPKKGERVDTDLPPRPGKGAD